MMMNDQEGDNMRRILFVLVLMFFLVPCLAGSASASYLPPDVFLAVEDDYSIELLAVQSAPNTPVESASGLKGILIRLFGPYSPTITQLRYQSNTSTNYTYVNDISPDYPWLCAAGIFAIVLYCTFKLGGTFLCKV